MGSGRPSDLGPSGFISTRTRAPAATKSRGFNSLRPTNTAPSSIQPLIRVRECWGNRRARALSRRDPANSGGIVRSITWNSALIRALEATVGSRRVYCRAFGPTQRAAHCKESLVRLRDLVQPGRIFVVAIGVAMLATGCRSHRAEDAKSGPEQIYAKAQKAIRS